MYSMHTQVETYTESHTNARTIRGEAGKEEEECSRSSYILTHLQELEQYPV
jgi:hypothetical protein